MTKSRGLPAFFVKSRYKITKKSRNAKHSGSFFWLNNYNWLLAVSFWPLANCQSPTFYFSCNSFWKSSKAMSFSSSFTTPFRAAVSFTSTARSTRPSTFSRFFNIS